MVEVTPVEVSIAACFDRSDYAGAATAALTGYGPEVLGYIASIAGNKADADDAFSDFTEALWRSLPEFRHECSFRTWLYRVAWSAVLRRQRDPFRKRGRRLETDEYGRLAERLRSTTAAHLRSENKDRMARLRKRLDRDERALLVLRLHRGLSWEEVAIALSPREGPRLTEVTVRKRFARLKDKLRKMAEAEGMLGVGEG